MLAVKALEAAIASVGDALRLDCSYGPVFFAGTMRETILEILVQYVRFEKRAEDEYRCEMEAQEGDD